MRAKEELILCQMGIQPENPNGKHLGRWYLLCMKHNRITSIRPNTSQESTTP